MIPGSACLWWDGAISGRGHGRFWVAAVDGKDLVVIAHRFGSALEQLVNATVTGSKTTAATGAAVRAPKRGRGCGLTARHGMGPNYEA